MGIISILGLAALIIMLMQFLTIRKFKKLFNDLSIAFAQDKNLDYVALVDWIIRSRELFKQGPSKATVHLISEYINGLFAESVVFIHVTNKKETADKILKEGFKYSEDFFKSSEEISFSPFDLTYKLQIYKHYGNYVMVICIPKELYYGAKISGIKSDRDTFVDYGISEYNPDDKLCYTMSNRFVRGYVDIANKQIVENELFKT